MEYLIVDVDSRIIKIPEEITHLGVKDDNETRTLKFQMPKVYKGLDLSDYSLEINFINANNKSDSALTENKQIDGDNITFEWCVGKSAYAKNGKVNFLVYAYLENEYGIKTNEWHTTWAKLDVLDGGNVNGAIAEENPRIIDEMLRRIKELENAEKDAVLYTAQTLTEEHQTQARANIGAASSVEVSRLSEEIEHRNGVKVVNSISEMVDTSTIYVLSTDGHWYYYNGAMWTDGGEFTGATISSTQIQSAVEDCLEENSQTMGTLTINGQQYNGSEDVVVEVASSSGSGSSETAQEAQLATGTIVTGTEANIAIETGVSLATLKQYKRFVFVFKGASNVALANTYLTFNTSGSYAIYRSSSSGGYVCGFEWLNTETNLLRVYGVYQGNPSLVRNIGSNFVVTHVGAILTDGLAGAGSIILFDLSDLEDTNTLKIWISGTTTIDYSWEIRGLTV